MTYKTLSMLAWPVLKALPYRRAYKGKEKKERIAERFGIAKNKRPAGQIIWFHATSNGETLSAFPLIEELRKRNEDITVLITTMTVTAADLVQKRMGHDENIIHQFIPYDHPSWIKKFHEFWQPNMVIWIESELWPNHLSEIKKRNIPAILANARLSEKSVKRWFWVNGFFQSMMSCFDTILAQTERDLQNLNILGLDHVQSVGNLKDIALPLPFDIVAADDIRGVIKAKPCVLYASTHDPEEDIARDIHTELKKEFPDLLSIIIPRHPKRGEDIANQFNDGTLNIARRSLKMSPRMDTDIYIADTLGEMGLFFHLCDIVFVGNSLGTKPGGGHNLMEPAWFDCAIVSGDDLHNFSTLAYEMPNKNACRIVKNTHELQNIFKELIKNSNLKNELSKNAYNYAQTKHDGGIESIMSAIEPTCKKAGIL